MGLRQLHTAETMFIDDGLTDGAVFPPSSNAVYDALQNATELPSVTADDNGDVLTVVSGAWAKATPSGGGGTFVVHSEYDDVTSTVTLDKTWKEIHDALVDGKIPIVVSDSEDYTSIEYIYATVMNSLESYAVYGFMIDTGSLVNLVFETNSEDGYPSFGDEDNGDDEA